MRRMWTVKQGYAHVREQGTKRRGYVGACLIVGLQPPKLPTELMVIVLVMQARVGLQDLADEVHQLL